MSYPSIADHGLIGDLQSAALVATDATIDWFCCPRFDSPSVFASLLDDRRGGRFALAPVTPARTHKQMYMPGSAILVTRFLSESGIAEVVDFMPIDRPRVVSDRRRIVRLVRGIRGEVEFEARVEPRFDYGRRPHQAHVNGTTAVFESGSDRLTLTSVSPLERDGDDVRSRFTIGAGDVGGFMLESGASGSPLQIGGGQVLELYLETEAYWQRWLEGSSYRGRWREAVERSAMTLKLMTYAPSGGLVAAPTAGLPEQVGGPRNWDYRYTWVRDGAFSVYSLLGLGFIEEAAAFGDWLRARLEEHAGNGSGPLQIMYRVDGSSDLTEETLDHLDGYMGSRPVRVGNGAADQLQLDIYGEAMNSIHVLDGRGRRVGRRLRGLEPDRRRDGLALRPLAGPRGGHLGDARWTSPLRLWTAHVVGGIRPRHPHGHEPEPPGRSGPMGPGTRPHPRADHDQGLERRSRCLRPVRRR